ncbi:3-dehydroquinate synthase [Alkalispirochaeta odontotermitis]|nr:3-dehydroquinate synthase [Alkalispirochaeta odontotermitis]CAB1071265.1 3-dehydroquinate synthase (EC [Olavius algarvensis Delta 1 endosymbiont]
MKAVNIKAHPRDSVIMIGERLDNAEKYIPVDKPVIITDTNVQSHWGRHFPPGDVIAIGSGEKSKTLDTVHDIYEQLLELEADRSCFIVGIGGGIVCDVAGFVASTYMRGVRFGFVSTTLLSQVDASVGGKNGFNLGGYKNIIGVFSQPEFVICDMDLLKTVPPEEILSGFAEIIKHGAIADKDLFDYLEENRDRALALDSTVIEKLVYESVIIKSEIVNQDEKEKGERRKLNFGHTFGHAIEKTTGVRHGEAVSAGMVLASKLAVKKKSLAAASAERLADLLDNYGLPVLLDFDRSAVLDTLRMDKKREGQRIHFVLLSELGRAYVEEIAISELEELIS